MILPDVNILAYAHRRSASGHGAYRDWLETLINGDAAYAAADVVLSGFIRIVTHPKIFDPPSTVDQALTFAARVLDRPSCVVVHSGTRHWQIFARLCRESRARGNAVPDAYLAALAIENGGELVSADRGFARFEGLRWRHPLG